MNIFLINLMLQPCYYVYEQIFNCIEENLTFVKEFNYINLNIFQDYQSININKINIQQLIHYYQHILQQFKVEVQLFILVMVEIISVMLLNLFIYLLIINAIIVSIIIVLLQVNEILYFINFNLILFSLKIFVVLNYSFFFFLKVVMKFNLILYSF